MYREIEVDGKVVPMEANAATCIRYRMLFKKNLDDLWTGANPYKSEGIAELAYIMAMSAAKADMNQLNYEGFLEWLSGFSGTAFLESFEDIYNLFSNDAKTDVEPKKKSAELNAK